MKYRQKNTSYVIVKKILLFEKLKVHGKKRNRSKEEITHLIVIACNPKLVQPSWDYFFLEKWRKRRNFKRETLKDTKQKEESKVQLDKKKKEKFEKKKGK